MSAKYDRLPKCTDFNVKLTKCRSHAPMQTPYWTAIAAIALPRDHFEHHLKTPGLVCVGQHSVLKAHFTLE